MGKNLTVKTLSGDFQVTTPETPLLSNKRLQARNPKYLTNLQLNPYPNTYRTCSIVTVPLSDARLSSTWLTVARISVRNFKTPIWKIVGCKVLQFTHTMKIRKMLGHKTLWCKYTATSPRKRWTKLRTLFPVTICLNRVCSMFVQCVYHLTALKTIILYV